MQPHSINIMAGLFDLLFLLIAKPLTHCMYKTINSGPRLSVLFALLIVAILSTNNICFGGYVTNEDINEKMKALNGSFQAMKKDNELLKEENESLQKTIIELKGGDVSSDDKGNAWDIACWVSATLFVVYVIVTSFFTFSSIKKIKMLRARNKQLDKELKDCLRR